MLLYADEDFSLPVVYVAAICSKGHTITPARKKRTGWLATLRRSVSGIRRFCEASLTRCALLTGRGNRNRCFFQTLREIKP